ncbi:unnamed protein product [Adineta ricciae]|uniref:Uncharacterized protein n=1 Tax=Adineta ricciae TaxID=249248 RepID=A0A814YFI0_ADIRI|nr:unnamed protein product [Adineta ricciae]CAF1229132.1 unnamed protein product [Adineta ricciae]
MNHSLTFTVYIDDIDRYFVCFRFISICQTVASQFATTVTELVSNVVQTVGIADSCFPIELIACLDTIINEVCTDGSAVGGGSSIHLLQTVSELRNIIRNVSNQSSTLTSSKLVPYSLEPYLSTMKGLNINNVGNSQRQQSFLMA